MYAHLLYQDLSFFDRLSTGELVARTSGDSLTVRMLISDTCFAFIEALLTAAGSLAFITSSSRGLLTSSPALVAALIGTLLLALGEAAAMGAIARRLNLRVRQALGRMFGFKCAQGSPLRGAAVTAATAAPALLLLPPLHALTAAAALPSLLHATTSNSLATFLNIETARGGRGDHRGLGGCPPGACAPVLRPPLIDPLARLPSTRARAGVGQQFGGPAAVRLPAVCL
jgi:ABC-type multidrug transport system fused ATPase/permease subunit